MRICDKKGCNNPVACTYKTYDTENPREIDLCYKHSQELLEWLGAKE